MLHYLPSVYKLIFIQTKLKSVGSQSFTGLSFLELLYISKLELLLLPYFYNDISINKQSPS